jgi:hypothetical protein
VADSDLRLEVSGGLEVSGVVLGPEGEPVAAAQVMAFSEGGFANGEADGEGRFRVGPIAGDVMVTASGRGLSRSEPVEARPGDDDLVLRLGVAGALRGTLLDGATGEPRAGRVTIAPSGGSDGFYGMKMTWNQADGRFSFDDLEPGTYDLSATTADGKVALRGGVVVSEGQPGAEVTLRAEPGAEVVVRYLGPRGHGEYRLLADGVLVGGDGVPRGTESTASVPAGALRVECYETRGGEIDAHEFRLALGERREVVFGQGD